jgi:hypothetical protein
VLWLRILSALLQSDEPSRHFADFMVLKFVGQSWQAAFAFALVGTIFLLWIMIMSYNVYQGD